MEGYNPHEQPSEEERQERNREAIEREEERLELLTQINDFRRDFGHWELGEGEARRSELRAVEAALDMVAAVLRGEGEVLKSKLGTAAMQLGYRVEEGAFEDSPSKDQQAQLEKDAEELRG
jgi:hypothetical protein